jgi:superfamily I DNA/RNA helicase
VEFGAHQVILVRTLESIGRLPEEIRNSNAIFLTVPQAKGLEFDDVYLINFFQDSEADSEWRVLCSFLEKIREERVR